jgi:hypothetical protein
MMDLIERLWGLMHKNVTPYKCYATCGEICGRHDRFLAGQSPRELAGFRNSVTGNVRVINPKDFRVPTLTGYGTALRRFKPAARSRSSDGRRDRETSRPWFPKRNW